MQQKRFWWAWRPADARGNTIDDCIVLGVWTLVAAASTYLIVSALVRHKSVDHVALPLILLALAIDGGSIIWRRWQVVR